MLSALPSNVVVSVVRCQAKRDVAIGFIMVHLSHLSGIPAKVPSLGIRHLLVKGAEVLMKILRDDEYKWQFDSTRLGCGGKQGANNVASVSARQGSLSGTEDADKPL
jgi:hypothetical protein